MIRMKKSIFIFIVTATVVLFGANALKAQVFQGEVIGGFNLTQVDGDEVYGYHRIGAQLGLAAILPIKKWDITLETLFSQKGSFRRSNYPGDSLNGQYDLRLNYVEVPLLVHYTDRQVIGAGIGFSYGRLVYAKEIEHKGNGTPYSDSVKFNKDDFNFVAEVQFRIHRGLKFDIRFSYSILPIRQRTYYLNVPEPFTRKEYNNALTFRLVYVFNDKYVKPKKPENQ